MDPDSKEFGIDFGPNTFRLSGPTLNARLDNVSTKYFEYSSVSGTLVATSLRTTIG